jgi:enamine deaminase RidA (YjgF/YER057c/UK114 family)
LKVLHPAGWPQPVGYANGIAATGTVVFIAGQVGWNERQQFESVDLAPQFEQALKNVIAVLAEAGGRPEHICRITAYCCDKPAYVAARGDSRAHLETTHGRHYPAMSMIFVSTSSTLPGRSSSRRPPSYHEKT